jgi:hypothetical protein
MGPKGSLNSLQTKKPLPLQINSLFTIPTTLGQPKVLLIFYFLYYFEEACYIRPYSLYENNFLC